MRLSAQSAGTGSESKNRGQHPNGDDGQGEKSFPEIVTAQRVISWGADFIESSRSGNNTQKNLGPRIHLELDVLDMIDRLQVAGKHRSRSAVLRRLLKKELRRKKLSF